VASGHLGKLPIGLECRRRRVPLGFNRLIARIFLDAAHDDLERPVRKRPLQLRPLKSDCGP